MRKKFLVMVLAVTSSVTSAATIKFATLAPEGSTWMKLMHELIKIRVRPYYLYQCDLARGTSHFRTSIDDGIEIMEI